MTDDIELPDEHRDETDMIGLWIARFTDLPLSRPLTKWHLVESEIEERKVTKCGRQMGERKGTLLAPLMAAPTARVTCKGCA